MIATTAMIAITSLQISLTLGIRRSLSIARRLPRWATGQSAVFLEEPEEGDAAWPEAHPTPSCTAELRAHKCCDLCGRWVGVSMGVPAFRFAHQLVEDSI